MEVHRRRQVRLDVGEQLRRRSARVADVARELSVDPSLESTRTLDLAADPAGRPLRPELRRAWEYSDCWVEDSRLVALNARDAAARPVFMAFNSARMASICACCASITAII